MKLRAFLVLFLIGLLSGFVFGQGKEYAVVTVSAANVRSGPATSYSVIYVAKAGEKFEVLEKVNSWYKIKIGPDKEGYIWANLVRIEVEQVKEKPAEKPSAPSQPPQPAQKPAAKISVMFEVFGGYSFLNPADLNLHSDAWDKSVHFYFHKYLEFLESQNFISNLELQDEGAFPTIKNAIPLGARVKFLVGKSFAFGLGVGYMSKTASATPTFTANYNYGGNPQTASYSFSDFSLSLSAVNPNITLHYVIPEAAGGEFGFEFYAGVGLLLAKAKFSRELNVEYPSIQINSVMERDGDGKGISVHAGLQGNFMLTENTGIFLAGEYLYGKVKKLTGLTTFRSHTVTSTEDRTSSTQYEGEWYITDFNGSEAWGSVYYEYPENNPNLIDHKTRDFVLDLSSVRLLLGLFIKF